MLDSTHPAFVALTELLPFAVVAGGSFASELPAIRSVRPEDRRVAMSDARTKATDTALASLVVDAGLPANVLISRGPDGDRLWPPGFVGSVSHKGTVVVAALASLADCCLLGIDVERIDHGSLDLAGLRLSEVPAGIPKQAGLTLVFSAKEAAFKAIFPTARVRFGFLDLDLDWTTGGNACHFEGNVHYGSTRLHVRATLVENWTVSIAFSLV